MQRKRSNSKAGESGNEARTLTAQVSTANITASAKTSCRLKPQTPPEIQLNSVASTQQSDHSFYLRLVVLAYVFNTCEGCEISSIM